MTVEKNNDPVPIFWPSHTGISKQKIKQTYQCNSRLSAKHAKEHHWFQPPAPPTYQVQLHGSVESLCVSLSLSLELLGTSSVLAPSRNALSYSQHPLVPSRKARSSPFIAFSLFRLHINGHKEDPPKLRRQQCSLAQVGQRREYKALRSALIGLVDRTGPL